MLNKKKGAVNTHLLKKKQTLDAGKSKYVLSDSDSESLIYLNDQFLSVKSVTELLDVFDKDAADNVMIPAANDLVNPGLVTENLTQSKETALNVPPKCRDFSELE